MRLSYERGNFAGVDAGSSGTISLAQPPVLMPAPGEPNHAKVRVVAFFDRDGLKQKLFLSGSYDVQFDIDIRFEKSPSGGLQVVLDHLDTNSGLIDATYMRASIFKRLILGAVRQDLQSADQGAQGEVLSSDIPLPSEIFGIPLHLNDFETDPNGYLTLYMSYGAIGQ